MSDIDFKFTMMCMIILSIFGLFTVSFYADMEPEKDVHQTSFDRNTSTNEGILDTLWVSTSFLNPFSEGFTSDIAIVDFMFAIFGFGIVLVILRFARGQ